MLNTLFIVNIFCSFALFGLIWIVQLVHYPFFLRADQNNFGEHIAFHKFRITLIVAPLMIIELVTSGILAFQSDLYARWHIFGFVVVIFIWLITFFVQISLHGKLADGYNENLIRKLIRSNWIRTFLWTIKALSGLLIAFFLIH